MKHAYKASLARIATIGVITVVAGAQIAEAGPQLICRTFAIGDAPSLPWGNRDQWDAPNAAYDVRRLTADVSELLVPSTPVLVRMETLRRATIYAASDPILAAELLSMLVARTQAAADTGAIDPAAWFDAGYLVESFLQANLAFEGGVTIPPHALAIDGHQWIERAIRESGGNAEMHLAAAFTAKTYRGAGATFAFHMAKAIAGAGDKSLLALNLQIFNAGVKSLAELRQLTAVAPTGKE